MHWRRKWQPTPVFLPGESQGRGSLLGGGLCGRTESDTTVSDLAAAAADGITYPFQDSRDHYKVFLNVYKRYIALD